MFARWLEEAIRASCTERASGPYPTFSVTRSHPSTSEDRASLWCSRPSSAIRCECRVATWTRSEATCRPATPAAARSSPIQRVRSAAASPEARAAPTGTTSATSTATSSVATARVRGPEGDRSREGIIARGPTSRARRGYERAPVCRLPGTAGTLPHPDLPPHRQESPTVAVEQTLILVKPDGVSRGLVGEVIARIERKGFTLKALELRTLERATAEEHYAEHTERPFFGELVDFITSAPLVAMCVEGENAIAGMRQIMGATNPIESAPGSIRGDFATAIGENIVHGSDSPESATRELGIFFPGRF